MKDVKFKSLKKNSEGDVFTFAFLCAYPAFNGEWFFPELQILGETETRDE